MNGSRTPFLFIFEQNCFFHNAATIFSHLNSVVVSEEQQTSPCVFCNISFHLVISLRSIKSTYIILKCSSLSDSVVCECVCVRAHVCVLMYKRSEHEHMGRVGVFWQRTATLPPFTTKAEKNSYISYLPVKFSTWAWKLSDWKKKEKKKENNQQHLFILCYKRKHIHFNTL